MDSVQAIPPRIVSSPVRHNLADATTAKQNPDAPMPSVVEEMDTKPHQNVVLSNCIRFKNWLAPNTLSEEGGSRIITLDIMRGMGIFFMMIMHEVGKFENALDGGIESLEEFSGINWFIVVVLGGLIVVFDNFKSFFALISGTTMCYLFFYKCEKLRYSQALKIQIFMLLQSCAMSLLWFLFDQLEPILQPQNGTLEISFPLHNYFTPFQQTPMFFGCAMIWQTIYCILCYWLFIVPVLEVKKRCPYIPIKICFWFLALLSYLLCWLIHMIFTAVNQQMNSSLIDHMQQYPTSSSILNVLKQRQECVVSHLGLNDQISAKYGLNYWIYYYVIHIISGRFMMLIPFIAYSAIGFAFGFIMVAFQQEKQECKLLPNEERRNSYLRRRTNYFVAMTASCLLSLVFYFVIDWQTRQDLISGRRIEYFSMKYFVNNGNLGKCLFPEYSAYMVILQQCIFVLCLFIFEARSMASARKTTQKMLFFRRYSTLSFSIFLFQSFFSLVTKTIWGLQKTIKYDDNMQPVEIPAYKCSPLETIFYLLFYIFAGHFVMIAMEKSGDVFTVDWVFSRARHLLTPGKGEFKPLSNQHLKVKPINIFGKDEIE